MMRYSGMMRNSGVMRYSGVMRNSGMMRYSGMMRNKRKMNARGWWSVCFSLFCCRLYGWDGRESENILNKVGYLLETRAKNKKIEKKALWSVDDEGKKRENWEKSPVVSWWWGQKSGKLRKKPCGQLEMEVKIREIEKKALCSVGDEGRNQENWEKSPVVCWRRGWKTRKLKKSPAVCWRWG